MLVSGAATDPDYRSLFPRGGGITGVEQQDGLIVVTVSGDGIAAGARMTPRTARLAVQSLVYTLQGVAQSTDPVEVRDESGPVPLFGIDTTGGVQRAPELDVLALVNVTTPEQGATVPGSFTAEGLASSFEGTVDWEIRSADGAVVQKGFTTADGYVDKLYPWTAQVDVSGLAPGGYVFAARTDDPSAGTEGPGPTEDTKAITVQ